MGQKILFVAIMFRLVSRVPALVIESAHQHWHLGSQVNGIISWQAVANRMQD
jgi:NADPH-dependent curcumin reductase CurA